MRLEIQEPGSVDPDDLKRALIVVGKRLKLIDKNGELLPPKEDDQTYLDYIDYCNSLAKQEEIDI